MQRRIFLSISAIGAIAVGFPNLYSCGNRTAALSAWCPNYLSRILDQQTIVKTGRAYLKKQPNEQGKKQLEEILLLNSKNDSPDPDQLRQHLESKIREDFENGRMVILNGWVLSVTEARQCALFSLTHS